MKNVSGAENSIFRKKGFFIALYSCLGVVAILAVVVTFATRSGETPYEDEPALYVGAGQADSYLNLGEDAWFRPRQTPEPPLPTPPPQAEPPDPEPVSDPGKEADEPEPPAPPPPVQETFEPFSHGDEMLWPLYGEVVMPFSITALIFDPTMDRYSTNDNMRIAASEGDPVRAGADGRVTAIGNDFWRGRYVTIDHGDGWTSTLGQLMDSVLVREGDIVRSGQVIGGVAQPSISGSLHGPHVHLHITHDNIPVNPYDLLQARE